MAKKKEVAVEQPIVENTSNSLQESEIKEEKTIYTPDVPAQMVDSEIVKDVKEISLPLEKLKVVPDSEEVVFLRRVLQIQREGGFGRHLDVLINDRINELKSK